MLNTFRVCLSLVAVASGHQPGHRRARRLSRPTSRATVAGVVRDSTGGAVAGAVVIVRTGSRGDQQTVTGPDGRFTIELPSAGEITLIVRAGGFAESERRLTVTPEARDIEVVLMPATLLEEVTVTPTRTEQRLGDMPASVNVLDARGDQAVAGRRRRRRAAAGPDVQPVPPHQQPRRRIPTTQGVSLRGIGPSGVSRTLVLLDGVPFNDPFGGWVYWTRVPLESVERIEIVDGSSSSLYGNYAMGGVINIVTSRPARRTRRAQAAVRQPGQSEVRLLRQRRVGEARRRGRRQLLQDRRLPDRRPRRSAGWSTTTRPSISRTSTSRSITTRPAA